MEERQDLYEMVGNYSIPQADIKDCKRCHNAELGTIIINGLCVECRDAKILEKDLLIKVMLLAQQSLSPIGYGKFEDFIDELIETRHIKSVLGYTELELELYKPLNSKESYSKPCVDCYRKSVSKDTNKSKAGYYCQKGLWDERGTGKTSENVGLQHGKCKERMFIPEAN